MWSKKVNPLSPCCVQINSVNK